MKQSPFLFRDFVRVKTSLTAAIADQDERLSLLVGETGTGKTALLRELKQTLDRPRFKIFYFSDAKRLRASALTKVLGEALRVRSSVCHALTFDRVQRTLQDEPQRILLWLDEAHELPEETLALTRAITESDLDGSTRIQVLLSGLPKLRVTLQEQPPLWRRIMIREEITGLGEDEVDPFLEHHFEGQGKRLCDRGLRVLFERAKGAPGLLLPMYRAILGRAGQKGKIEVKSVEDAIERWDLA
jgi:MSHA biogenesis protein MshM